MAQNIYEVYEENDAQVYKWTDEDGNQYVTVKSTENGAGIDYSGLGFLADKTSDLIIHQINKKERKKPLPEENEEKERSKSKIAKIIRQGKEYWEENKEPLIKTIAAVGFAFIGAAPEFFRKDNDYYDYLDEYDYLEEEPV